MRIKRRSSKDIINENIIPNLREYNIRWIVPSDIHELGGLKTPEDISKIKRILSTLVFIKALKFNKKYMLWENQYCKGGE